MNARILNIAIAIVALSAHPTVASAGEDGFALLLETLRNAGSNPAVIQSGRLHARVHSFHQPISEAQYRKEFADYKKEIENRRSMLRKDDVVNHDLTAKALKNAEADFRDLQRRLSDKSAEYDVSFRGVDPFVDVKQRISIPDRSGAEQLGDEEGDIAIGSSFDGARFTFIHKVRFYPKSLNVVRDYGVLPFNEFGRVRGNTLQFLTALLLLGTADHREYRFNRETIEKVRNLYKTLPGDALPYRVLKKVEFEGGTVSVLEIPLLFDKANSTRLGFNKTHVWVDPARGYICPKIEEFDGDRVVRRFDSTGFFLDPNSGLWWPRVHKVTEYDEKSPVIKEEETFTMAPETTALNITIADDEFVYHATRGMNLQDDQRGNPGSIYHVVKDTSLRLKDGVLDVANNPALVPQDSLFSRMGLSPGGRGGWFSRMWFVAANVGVMLFVLAFFLNKRRRARAAKA